MYKKEDLYTWDDYGLPLNIVFRNQKLTLDDFENILNSQEGLPSMGIQYELQHDQIKSGGGFKKKIEDCLVLRTSEIPGCARFVFGVQGLGNVTELSVYRDGVGASQAQINKKEHRMHHGGAISRIAGAVTKIDGTAMQREQLYYDMVIDVIRRLFINP